jgi:hypothetical protein
VLFMSTSGRLAFELRGEEKIWTEKGDLKETKAPLFVQFRPGAGLMPKYAQEAVRALPRFGRGMADDDDPLRLAGWFDTRFESGWTAEEAEEAEKLLLEKFDYGIEYILVEAPKAVAPWPNYDKQTSSLEGDALVKSVLDTVTSTGIPLGNVVVYELENKARPELIEALETVSKQLEGDVEEELEVSAI